MSQTAAKSSVKSRKKAATPSAVTPTAEGRAQRAPAPSAGTRAAKRAGTAGKPAARALRVLSPEVARRLAVTRQHLAGPIPEVDSAGMFQQIRDLGCLQLDPISVVARSHQIVLFSRLGSYDPMHLDKLLWKERKLFEYWAHAASIVLTEDYPVHAAMMQSYRDAKSGWPSRVREWMQQNEDLRVHILEEIGRRGPLPSRHFEDKTAREWESTGWNAGRNVGRMLDFLWVRGELLVAGRAGQQKLWDLADRCLPGWTPRHAPSREDLVRQAAQKALRALGVGRPRHIQQHYIRGRYPGLAERLAELQAQGLIEAVEVRGEAGALPGPWYVHAEDLPLLERLEAGEWEPRTVLLSPFDNLICDRARTELLFDFEFRMEIYVPKAKRRYGYYVLPILHGDRLIGRVDPAMDREAGRLKVHAVHAERGAPATKTAGQAVAGAIEALASWLGASGVDYGSLDCPAAWKRALA